MDDPRQFWYDVSGFQDEVKLRASAGGAVESFLHLVFLFLVIYTTDTHKVWNVPAAMMEFL
jgi:hypothetical protein